MITVGELKAALLGRPDNEKVGFEAVGELLGASVDHCLDSDLIGCGIRATYGGAIVISLEADEADEDDLDDEDDDDDLELDDDDDDEEDDDEDEDEDEEDGDL